MSYICNYIHAYARVLLHYDLTLIVIFFRAALSRRNLEDPVDPSKCRFHAIPCLANSIMNVSLSTNLSIRKLTWLEGYALANISLHGFFYTCNTDVEARIGDRRLRSMELGYRMLEDPVDPAKCKPLAHLL